MILELTNVRKTFYKRTGLFAQDPIHAVVDVSLSLRKGEVLGVVGESGCGKTTVARCVTGLQAVSSGSIRLAGEEIGSLGPSRFRPYRKRVQMVFQDPSDSLNARFTVRRTLREPLDLHTRASRAEKEATLRRFMDVLGLRREHLDRYPHQLSTGQQQRVGIARAIICNPDVVVLDEPTAALDVSVRGKVLELLLDLRARFGLSYVLISHDLATVRHISDRTAVMYLGSVVEEGPTAGLFEAPRHPYTRALLASIPTIATRRRTIAALGGEVPSPINRPTGCPFSTRCPDVMDVCRERMPPPVRVDDVTVRCHLYPGDEGGV